ncbi:MAG: acyltransferase family protein [Ferrimicrobium sp.]
MIPAENHSYDSLHKPRSKPPKAWRKRRPDGNERAKHFEPLGHRPALDGLRALAFLGVFVGHANLLPGSDPGTVSMFIFFGLSGFLITSLLLDERWTNGRISLRNFAARRGLRLLPALVAFLLIWLAVVLIYGGHPWITTVPGGGPGTPEPIGTALQGVGAALGYVLNWAEILHLFGHYLPIAHLWSLSVEEQFYMIWAPTLTLLLAWRSRLLPTVTLLLAIFSFMELPPLWDHGFGQLRIYMGSDTRAATFLLGGLAAFIWANGGARWLRRRWLGVSSATLSIFALVWATTPLSKAGASLGPATAEQAFIATWIVCAVAAPLLVASAASMETGLFVRALSSKTITYIGRRSYALYLWHYVWLTWFRSLGLAGVALALMASFACAELSWRLIEAPALSFKTRFAASPTTSSEQEENRELSLAR